MSPAMQFALGLVLAVAILPTLSVAFRAITVEVEDEELVLVTRFGKLAERLERPGLHVLLGQIFPWVKLHRVSLRKDFRDFNDVHVNDARGTTVMVDLWLEFRISDPVKALFQVADWDRSMQNIVAHAATSILGNREFKQILCDRTELGAVLRHDISEETSRWGITIEQVYVRNVRLLPDVSRQIFEAVAARLERAHADIEEAGRLAVAKLEADTSVRVAALVAEAKGQYPTAVSRAFGRLAAHPAALTAYNELYALSQLRPHRTIAFRGFGDELRAVDAAMLTIPGAGPDASHGDASSGPAAPAPAAVPPLSGHDHQVIARGPARS